MFLAPLAPVRRPSHTNSLKCARLSRVAGLLSARCLRLLGPPGPNRPAGRPTNAYNPNLCGPFGRAERGGCLSGATAARANQSHLFDRRRGHGDNARDQSAGFGLRLDRGGCRGAPPDEPPASGHDLHCCYLAPAELPADLSRARLGDMQISPAKLCRPPLSGHLHRRQAGHRRCQFRAGLPAPAERLEAGHPIAQARAGRDGPRAHAARSARQTVLSGASACRSSCRKLKGPMFAQAGRPGSVTCVNLHAPARDDCRLKLVASSGG